MNRRLVNPLLAAVLALAPLAGCSNSDQVLGPAETVEHVAQRLADGHPVSIWNALPASYQSDVSGLLHEFSKNVDRTVWNKTFMVMAKLTRLLREKQLLILEHPLVQRQIATSDSIDIEGDWNKVIKLIDLVATSELANLDVLAELDIEAFLRGTGWQFMHQIAALTHTRGDTQDGSGNVADANDPTENTNSYSDYIAAAGSLRTLEATLLSEQGDRATVGIQSAGQNSRTEEFVRVEGKWIPASLADGWQGQLAQARNSIAKMSSDESQSETHATLLKLSMMEGVLNSLLAAETTEQFSASIGAATGAMIGIAMQTAMARETETALDASPASPGASIQYSTPTGTLIPVETSDSSSDALDSGPANLPSGIQAASPEPASPIESDTSAASTAERPVRTTVSFDTPPIPVSEANRHVGQRLRIIAADGMDVVAVLSRANGDTLTFEQPLSAGVMSFKMRKQEIESLHAAR